MTDHEFPTPPEIETAYKTAYKALATLVPPDSVSSVEESHLTEVLSQFRSLVDHAELAIIGRLGSPVTWQGPRQDGDWDLIVAGIDLDDAGHDFGEVELGTDAFEGPARSWHDSALQRAGFVYKRACGWDHAPGGAGVWVVMLAPTSGAGSDDSWFYSGRVVGFVVVYDRDDDGVYESVGHIWTATAWQRRGIARRLLAEARSRFPIASVEKPYTNDGKAFLNACPDTRIPPQD
jgi:ribosomal protein S18 acetylase RimI-like enzyme